MSPRSGLPVHIERDFAPCQASIVIPPHAAIPHFLAAATDEVSRPFAYGISKNTDPLG